MTGDVYTDCPQCGVEIPFYHTVDEKKECPECGTPSDDLFDIAMGKMPANDAATDVAVTDGGEVDE